MRLNPVPLSSDAFSKFGKDSEVDHNEEVLDATIRLEGQVVPEFAVYLEQRYADSRLDTMRDKSKSDLDAHGFEEDSPAISLARNPHRQLEELGHLIAEMHLRGINIRYSLAIHSLLSSTLISRLLLTEVVARSAKHLIDDMWRGLDSLQSDIYRKETANFFTTMFSMDSDSAEFWNSILAAEVDDRFGAPLRRVRTPEMSLHVDQTATMTASTGFGAHPSSVHSTPTSSPQTSLVMTSSGHIQHPTGEATEAPRSLRLSNPRNQIRSSPTGPPTFVPANPNADMPSSQHDPTQSVPLSNLSNSQCVNNLSAETSLNAVDGNLLRKGIDPTLLLFRVCQLCGVELDFAVWKLPSPTSESWTSPNPILAANVRTVLQNSDLDDSVEGSQEDSLASLWPKVENFMGTYWSNPLSASAPLTHLHDAPASPSSFSSPLVVLPSSVSSTTGSSSLKRVFPIEAILRIIARTKYLNRISYEEGTALSRLALSKTGQESLELLSRAHRKFQECLEIKPDDSKALLNWALVLTKQAELVNNTAQSSSLWKEAFSKYECALVLRPTDWRALTSWGTAISSQAAKVPQVSDGIALYRAAIDKFDRALKLLPLSHFHTLYNTANARLKLARLLLDDLRAARTVRAEKSVAVHRECSDLLTTSIARFQEALEIEGTNVNAMHNLAVALATQARICGTDNAQMSGIAQVAERDRLYQSAYLIYQRAIHLIPTSVDIYYGWGNALFRHALAKREAQHHDDQAAFCTLCDAATRYQAAIIISQKEEASFSRDVFINFGNVLMLGVKLSNRLRIALPSAFMNCCSCYLGLVEQPQLYERESSAIAQVLLAFKKYLPNERSVPATVPPPSSQPPLQQQQQATQCSPKDKTKSQKILGKVMDLLVEMGEGETSSGNVLSGSGGSTSSEQTQQATQPILCEPHPKPKKKTKSPLSPNAATATGGHGHKEKEMPSSSPSHLSRKRSAKTISAEPKSEAKTDAKASSADPLKKSSPKIDLTTATSSPSILPAMLSPSSRESSSTDIPSDSVARTPRQGTTSKLRQKIGSFFGIRSKSPAASTPSPSSSSNALYHPPPNSPLSSPHSAAASPPISIPPSPVGIPTSPRYESISISSPTSDGGSVVGSSPALSPSSITLQPTLSAPISKSRSKKKPGRSLSYAEDIRPRTSSSATNSSTTVTTSSSSGGGGSKASQTETDILVPFHPKHADFSPKDHHHHHHHEEQMENDMGTTMVQTSSDYALPNTRARRKSDADSHIPLRRQSTTSNISPSPRSKQASLLAQSSPLLARSKPVTGRPSSPISHSGDYSSLNNETIHTISTISSSILSLPNSAINGGAKESPTTERDSLVFPAGSKSGVVVGSSVSLTASASHVRVPGDEEREDIHASTKERAAPSKLTKSSTKERPSSASKSKDKTRKSSSNAAANSNSMPSATSTKRKSASRRDRKSGTVTIDAVSSQQQHLSSVPSSSSLPIAIDWTKPVLYMESGEKEVKENEFIVKGVLGSSRSGLVFLGRREEVDYAMKVRLPEVLAQGKPKLTPFFDYPFFVKLKCLFFADAKLIMAFQLVRGPQLLEYVLRNVGTLPREGPKLDHLVLNLVAAQLVSAFSYLSEVVKIPYRDFKPSNILINDSGNIILTTHCEEDSSSLAFSRADISYLAPEIVIKIRERRALAGVLGKGPSKALSILDDNANRVEDERASWWSLGMYLLVIATGSNPFHSEDAMKMEENVLRKKLLIPQNLGKLSSLLNGLLDRDITARICSADQVRRHPYFHNMDWNKLMTLGYHPPFLPNITNASKRNLLDSRSMNSTLTSSKASLNSSSLDTSLDLSSTAGQIALMNTMVMPDVGNQLEGNTMFVQNTSMMENQLCASSSASASDSE